MKEPKMVALLGLVMPVLLLPLSLTMFVGGNWPPTLTGTIIGLWRVLQWAVS